MAPKATNQTKFQICFTDVFLQSLSVKFNEKTQSNELELKKVVTQQATRPLIFSKPKNKPEISHEPIAELPSLRPVSKYFKVVWMKE